MEKKREQHKDSIPVSELLKSPLRFYQSVLWEKLRKRAVKSKGFKCQCCGKHRRDCKHIHIRHVKSVATHPEEAYNMDNFTVLCDTCDRLAYEM